MFVKYWIYFEKLIFIKKIKYAIPTHFNIFENIVIIVQEH
jgi:hypothetical protein